MPPSCRRRPSQTPSPRTKPESKTETVASARGTSRPLTEIRIAALRGSSTNSWVEAPVEMVGVVMRETLGYAGSMEHGSGATASKVHGGAAVHGEVSFLPASYQINL